MSSTPADWYPDPHDDTQLRYWDGSAWTDHYAPRYATEPAAEEPAEPTPAEEPPDETAEVDAEDHAAEPDVAPVVATDADVDDTSEDEAEKADDSAGEEEDVEDEDDDPASTGAVIAPAPATETDESENSTPEPAPTSAVPPVEEPPVEEEESDRRLLIIAAVVLLLAGAVGAYVVLSGADDTATESTSADEDATAETTTTTTTTSTTTTTTTTTTTVPEVVPATVPDLAGLDPETATLLAQESGFSIEGVEVETADFAPGTVISQTPASGAESEPGAAIVVEIAVAPPADCNDLDGPAPAPSFPDVLALDAAFSVDSVGWAESVGIVAGSGGEFRPNDFVTRGTLLTLVWRYACSPAPTAPASFTDIPADAFYADAVAWGVEAGLIGDGEIFDPNGEVPARIAAFVLWNFAGSPAPQNPPPLEDVPAGEFYTDAVFWAAETQLIVLTSPTTFEPDLPMTRLNTIEAMYQLELLLDPEVG